MKILCYKLIVTEISAEQNQDLLFFPSFLFFFSFFLRHEKTRSEAFSINEVAGQKNRKK